MRPFLIAILTSACAVQPVENKELDAQPLSEALTFSDPRPMVDLEETLRGFTDNQCPQVDISEGIETWIGGCETESGLQIDGQIQLLSQRWLTANAFSIKENGKTLLLIDGGLENHIVGDLLQLDFTGEICGVHIDDCSSGLIQLELNATIYPLSDYPSGHETSVHGFINGESPIGFEGSWSKDESSCALEASDGVFGIWQDVRQDLVLNGTENCDGCAEWRIQGSKEAEYCGELP